jgi:hypothetical protein
VLRSIHQGFAELDSVDTDSIESAASDLESSTTSVQCEYDHEVEVDLSSEIADIESAAQGVADDISSAEEKLKEFLAFIKTFGPTEFSTIYCEREWRSTEPFPFSAGDVAMIVLPKGNARESYFEDFVSKKTRTLGVPRSIPVVPWEDLIEH